MGQGKNRGLRIFVDGDNLLGFGHAGPVLDLSGNPASDIEIGAYCDTCLPDLMIFVEDARINYGPGTTLMNLPGSCAVWAREASHRIGNS